MMNSRNLRKIVTTPVRETLGRADPPPVRKSASAADRLPDWMSPEQRATFAIGEIHKAGSLLSPTRKSDAATPLPVPNRPPSADRPIATPNTEPPPPQNRILGLPGEPEADPSHRDRRIWLFIRQSGVRPVDARGPRHHPYASRC